MSSDLFNMALQLSVQDIFTGSWFTNAIMHKVWAELVRARVDGLIQSTRGSLDLTGQALGGRLRGDAAMLRGAASNVQEARAMMDTAASAAASIAEQTGEAGKLMQEFLDAAAGMDPAGTDYGALLGQYAPRYEAISKSIGSLVGNTRYNGIALLDGAAWAADERVSGIPAGGVPTAGSVHIQAGTDGFPLTFTNMRPQFADLSSVHALNGANADSVSALSALQGTAQSLADMYAGRAGGLKGQAVSLQSQAAVLEEAALRRAEGPSFGDPGNLLLNLILRDTGSLFNGKG